MSIFLTDFEMRNICAPLVQPAAICRWFKRSGFVFKPKPNGMPLISRSHYEQVMGQAILSEAGRSVTDSPNREALMGLFGSKTG